MGERIVHMSQQNRAPAGAQEAAAQLDRLSDEFFEVVHTTDPFNATQLGVSGFIDRVVTRWADQADGSPP
jgi:hypothetical protein